MRSGIAALAAFVVACGSQRSENGSAVAADASSPRATEQAPAGCPVGWFRYEPAVVDASGTLTVVSRYGPPNFGEQPDTDEKLSVPLLVLDRKISVCADSSSDVNNENVVGLDTLQLVTARQLDPYAGRRVSVSGRLSRAVTGYHLTPAVLQLDSIRVAQ